MTNARHEFPPAIFISAIPAGGLDGQTTCLCDLITSQPMIGSERIRIRRLSSTTKHAIF
jgi:hypothetical protein